MIKLGTDVVSRAKIMVEMHRPKKLQSSMVLSATL